MRIPSVYQLRVAWRASSYYEVQGQGEAVENMPGPSVSSFKVMLQFLRPGAPPPQVLAKDTESWDLDLGADYCRIPGGPLTSLALTFLTHKMKL